MRCEVRAQDEPAFPIAGTSTLEIAGYASLWGLADLNGDVVAKGAFAESLTRTGAAGVRMLHQHEERAVIGVWDEMVEDDRGLFVRGRIFDWSAEARFAQALSRAGVGRAVDRVSHGEGAARREVAGAEPGRAVGGVAGDVSHAAGGAVSGHERMTAIDPERTLPCGSIGLCRSRLSLE